METCTDAFEELARQAGGIDCTDPGLLTLSNPFALTDPSMLVIEVLLIVGAVAGVLHAWRRKETEGQTAGLIVWLAGIVALVVVEPITYFPEWFGLEDRIGLTFIHNQFTVQFLFNRLPLYIVAMYPVYAYLAYELVRRAGIVERCRPVVSAISIAFTFFVFFEVIDQLGPQLRWWIWSYTVESGDPQLGSVPYSSLAGFSFAVPFGLAYFSIVLSRRNDHWLRNVFLASAATWPTLVLFGSLPTAALGVVGVSAPDARVAMTWLLFLGSGAVTAWAFVVALGAAAPDGLEPNRPDRFVLGSASIYLVVVAGLWVYSWSGRVEGASGLSPDGGRIGSIPFTVLCLVACFALVGTEEVIARRRRGVPVVPTRNSARVELAS